jgi:hypothetical protein
MVQQLTDTCPMCDKPLSGGVVHDYHIPKAPARAPGQPGTKMSKGAVVALVIVGLLIFGAISNALDGDDDSSNSPTVTTDTEFEITAELIVDTMAASAIADFCQAYETLGNYEVAFAAFKTGYTDSDPAPEEVFDEALSRC